MPEPSSKRSDRRVSELFASPLPLAAVRDRVIRGAISQGLVRATEIGRYWREFVRSAGNDRSLRFWRFVADKQGPDREQFYALAARTYGFDEVEISVSDLIRFLQEVQTSFSDGAWRQMNTLRILPIGIERSDDDGSNAGEVRMVFASSDPTRIEVNNYLATLPVRSFVLRYASARSIDYVLDRVLEVVFSRRGTSNRTDRPRLAPLDPIRSAAERRRRAA